MATNTAPGLARRHWPFFTFPDFDRGAFLAAAEEARAAVRPWKGLLLGNDVHSGALGHAERDAAAAGVATSSLRLAAGDCGEWRPAARPALVATNPPWGVRLNAFGRGGDHGGGRFGRGDDRGGGRFGGGGGGGGSPEEEEAAAYLEDSWGALSTFLKRECPEASAAVLSGAADATRHLRMRADRRLPVSIGGIEAMMLKYRVLPPLPPREEGAGGGGGAAVAAREGAAAAAARDDV